MTAAYAFNVSISRSSCFKSTSPTRVVARVTSSISGCRCRTTPPACTCDDVNKSEGAKTPPLVGAGAGAPRDINPTPTRPPPSPPARAPVADDVPRSFPDVDGASPRASLDPSPRLERSSSRTKCAVIYARAHTIVSPRSHARAKRGNPREHTTRARRTRATPRERPANAHHAAKPLKLFILHRQHRVQTTPRTHATLAPNRARTNRANRARTHPNPRLRLARRTTAAIEARLLQTHRRADDDDASHTDDIVYVILA